MALDLRWAFGQYEAVRAALPKAHFSERSEQVERLGDVLERFDLFLLDAFGVLNIGETAIPGASGFIAALRRRGKRVMVLSNSASVPTGVTHEKFRRLGFDFTAEEIVTSRDALKIALADEPPRRWGVMATGQSEIGELGIDATALGDDPAAYASVEGFILLGSGEWTEHRQRLLIAACEHRPRPVLVGNPDIVAPRETGLSREPGHYAHDLARHTGYAPRFFGKPFANVFDAALGVAGSYDPVRTVMVGDTLHTDVLGGAAYGVKTILLADYGLFAGEDVGGFIGRSGIVPDIIAKGL